MMFTCGIVHEGTPTHARSIVTCRDAPSLQLIQAFPFDTSPRYVIRDRDSIYGEDVVATIRALGIEDKVLGHQSP